MFNAVPGTKSFVTVERPESNISQWLLPQRKQLCLKSNYGHIDCPL